MMVGMVNVADCQRVQTNWLPTRAEVLGGEVWTDEGMLWTDGPDGLNVMFPEKLDRAALQRGIERAREAGRGIVGAWLRLDVDTRFLAAAGFERGWSPWWMTAELAEVPQLKDLRVRLELDSDDYRGEFASCREQLALARARPTKAWYAAAHTTGEVRLAGRAWSFLDDEVAGIFDMDVWPRFRRQGIGTGLLAAVCAPAMAAGARYAVLNATPEGQQLYSANGFTQIGEGITWWLHLGA